MEWSEESVIKLIDAYRAKSLLWDPQHKDHFRKPLKADAWRDIEAEINIDADQCKKKMISLLSSYRREKQKIKSSQGTGKGRDDIYVSRWFAYKAFKFLEDRDVPRKRLTTALKETRDDKLEPSTSSPEPEEQTRNLESINLQKNQNYKDITPSTSKASNLKRVSQVTPQLIPKKKPRLNEVVEQATSRYQTISNEYKESEDDEFDLFCKSLAYQLKKMPLERALACQEKLQSVMTQERLHQIASTSYLETENTSIDPATQTPLQYIFLKSERDEDPENVL